jgi:cardiolipin synthase
MDMRSFSLNLEVTLMIVDDAKVAEIEQVFTRYLMLSTELDLAQWSTRPWYVRYLDNTFRLTSALQ